MTVIIAVKQAIVKSFITSLLANKAIFEFNAMNNNFRIYNVRQWMFMTEKDAYLLSVELLNDQMLIHKDNIEQLCIAEDAKR